MATRSLRFAQHLRRRILAALSITALVCGAAVVAPLAAVAQPGGAFDPGNIISDSNFYNNNSMTTQEIQSFLDAQVPNCTLGTAGRPAGGYSTDPSSYGTLLASNCLKSYTESVNSIAADRYCDPINAGTYTGAGIIKAVSDACGISPKVMLVLLQKEQSLINDSWPSARQYSFATGFNCPDTAPCGALSAGFFKQVYAAARQFQVYTYFAQNFTQAENRRQGFNYFIGSNSIQFHPNSSCGASQVNIVNQATANLYIYTPYQPNASALANLYGGGDSCGAYGNRNFWRMYWDWFGSPNTNGIPEIRAYAAANAATLGVMQTNPTVYTGNGIDGAHQSFINASLYWTAKTNVVPVKNPFLSAYARSNVFYGPLSWPQSAEEAVTASGITGKTQKFLGGVIYSSSLGTIPMYGGFGKLYEDLQNVSGVLGWPKSTMTLNSASTGYQQLFQNGVLATTSSGPVYSITGDIYSVYSSKGLSAGSLGMPKSVQTNKTARGIQGKKQDFANGSIFSSSRGTFAVEGDIWALYKSKSAESGDLGWPVSAVRPSSSGGGTEQEFQNGTISQTPSRSPWISEIRDAQVSDAFAQTYALSGGSSGSLGSATGNIQSATGNSINGQKQTFSNGSIYGSSLGNYAVSGGTFTYYASLQEQVGNLGWPTGAMAWNGNQTLFEQKFQNGVVVTTSSGPPLAVYGPFYPVYKSLGLSAGNLGKPLSADSSTVGNGVSGSEQLFAQGAIYSSSLGAFGVFGGAYTLYNSLQNETGSLGWPKGAMGGNGKGTGYEQKFQNGVIATTAAGPAQAVIGAFDTVYLQLGRSTGRLGLPTTAATSSTANGISGTKQSFVKGNIYSSSLGTFALYDGFGKFYADSQAEQGPLGWPTTVLTANSVNTGYEQKFQNGMIATTASGPVQSVTGSIFTSYNAWGRSSGNLGLPTAAVVPLTASSQTGKTQKFAGGNIYESNLGTYPVFGGFNSVHLAAGGVNGRLGWPTSAPRGVAGGYEQTFQGGKITTVGTGIARIAG